MVITIGKDDFDTNWMHDESGNPDSPLTRARGSTAELATRLNAVSRDAIARGTDMETLMRLNWNPALHPRNPETGKFVERRYGVSSGSVLDQLGDMADDIERAQTVSASDFEASTGLSVGDSGYGSEYVIDGLENLSARNESVEQQDRPLSDDALSAAVESFKSDIDLSNTEEMGANQIRLDGSEATNVEDALTTALGQALVAESDVSGAAELSPEQLTSLNMAVSNTLRRAGSWKGNSYSDESQSISKAFQNSLDLPGDVRNDVLDGLDPTETEEKLAAILSAVSQEYVRENHGETRTVYRGVQEQGSVSLALDILENPNADEYEVSENAISNYTPDEMSATTWSANGVSIEQEVRAEDTVNAIDSLLYSTDQYVNAGEGEIWYAGGDRKLSADNIRVSGMGASQSTLAEIDVLSEDFIAEMADTVEEISVVTELSNSQIETLREMRDIAQSAADSDSGGDDGGIDMDELPDSVDPEFIEMDASGAPSADLNRFIDAADELLDMQTGFEPADEGGGSDESDSLTLDPAEATSTTDFGEFGEPSGMNAHAMDVVQFEAGHEAYVKNIGEGGPSDEDGERALAGAATLETIYESFDGAGVPAHEHEQGEYLSVEGVDGQVAYADDVPAVDYEDFLTFAASNLIAGNSDMHKDNAVIDAEGALWSIDMDHSGGDFTQGLPDKAYETDHARRGMEYLIDTGKFMLDDAPSRDAIGWDILTIAGEMADEVDEEELRTAIEEVSTEEFAENIITNLRAAAAKELLPEYAEKPI